MSRKKLDARKVQGTSKKAQFSFEDLLPEEQRKELQKLRPEEQPGEAPLPTTETGEELPPPEKKFPGAPKQTVRPRIPGQTSESPDIPGYTKHGPKEQTGMTPEEIQEKREEFEKKKPKREGPTWREVAQEKLKHLTPEEKSRQRLVERYGPAEKLQEAAQGLSEFGEDLASVDLESARNYINRLDLPDIIKERADRILRGKRYAPGSPNADEQGEIPISGARIFQHALNQLITRTEATPGIRKQTEELTNWLNDTEEGQQFLEKAREQYLVRNVVNMIENAILRQEGQGVIDQPKPERRSPQQKQEEKRLKKLKDQLSKGEITKEQYNKLVGGQPVEEEEETPTPPDSTIVQLNELQRKFNAGEISEEEYKKERARLLSQGAVLSLRKQADTEGPGGDEWWSDYESGPQLNREKYKKRRRFPFHNEPSSDIRVNKGPAKHDLPVPDGGSPAADDSWGLLASMGGIRKTADNDIFECHSYGKLTEGPWITYTLFKRATQGFRPGDIVVQFGRTSKDVTTYRRRFGNTQNANKNITAALLPAVATVLMVIKADKALLPKTVRLPGKPTPDESLHDLPDSKDDPVGEVYGPWTSEYDKQPWQGNRDGFDRKTPPRREQDVRRNVFPFEDSELSNQTKIFNKLNLRKVAYWAFTDKGSQYYNNLDLFGVDTSDPEFNLKTFMSAARIGGDNLNEIAKWLRGTIPDISAEDALQITRSGAQEAAARGFIIIRDTPLPLKEFDKIKVPGNLPEGIANKLNLRKTAGWNITDKGREVMLSRDFRKTPENQHLVWFLNLIKMYPDMTMDQANNKYENDIREAGGFFTQYEGISAIQDGAQEAIRNGYAIYTEPELQEDKFDLPENVPIKSSPSEWNWNIFPSAKRLNLKKQSKFVTREELEGYVKNTQKERKAEVGGYSAPVVETPEERVSTPEQNIPKPLAWDPKRPFKQKRKRYDLNESQLYNQNEYTSDPKTLYTKLNLTKKHAFDFNVSIFNPQTGQFTDETVITSPSMEQAQLQAQEFVNKTYPGHSFQVTDPYTETPKTLGVQSVSESKFMDNKLNLKKDADTEIEPNPVLRNRLLNLFQDSISQSGEVTLESVDKASKDAISLFRQYYPNIPEKELVMIARDADDFLESRQEASNLTNTALGNPLL